MKRTHWLAALIVALGIFGCSSSGPEISTAKISDDNPVTGQRILLQVISETDNPPMQYVWDCSSGIFETSSRVIQAGEVTDKYYIYWIPVTKGSFTITCTIIDADNNRETVEFPIKVEARKLIELWKPSVDYRGMILMTKDYNTKVGGIWTAMYGRDLHYYYSTGHSDLVWGKDYTDWDNDPLCVLAVAAYSSYYYVWNSFWAVRAHNDAWQTISYAMDEEDTYSCTSGDCDDITAVNVMRYYEGKLWIGTNQGLFTAGTADEDWDGPEKDSGNNLIPAVNDIYAANGLIYVATPKGIWYTSDSGDSWEHFNDDWETTAITAHKNPTGEMSIYARTNSDAGYVIKKFSEDGLISAALPAQPPADDWIGGLDCDPIGRIWYGKYYFWEASLGGDDKWWSVPADPDDPHTGYDDSSDHIVRSLVSPEGLTYLQTTTGALMVWGKFDD